MRTKKQEAGAAMLMAIALVLGFATAVWIYYQSALMRSQAVETAHDVNRAFNLSEVALNEAIHQLNMTVDGVDNNGNGSVDEAGEGDPSFGCASWDPNTDDLGTDGAPLTNDYGEGNGLPTFGEPNVTPVQSAQGTYYAYTINWETDGFDNNQDGLADDQTEAGMYEINAFGREGTGEIYWITVVVGSEDVSVWGNAIFAGDSGAGAAIRGNALVHGSIHILGDDLAPTDFALNMSGTSGMRNDYTGIDATIQSKIPALTGPDLDAQLRVKHGRVGLSGNATIGQATLDVDGVYVNDGYGGTAGENNVYSANGVDHQYDLPEGTVAFPLFSDPYTDPMTGIDYPTYKDFFTTTSLRINSGTVPGWNGTINNQTASFSVTNGASTFAWNQATKTLTVSGKVTIDGNLTLGGTTGPTKVDFAYTGRGTIMSQSSGGSGNGTVTIHGDLLPSMTFPTGDVLGIMAETDLVLPASDQKRLTGAFYAQGKVSSAKQNQIGGTLVGTEVDMGSQVPSVYQVPSLTSNLPPGIIGSEPVMLFRRLSWREH